MHSEQPAIWDVAAMGVVGMDGSRDPLCDVSRTIPA